ncbi:PP2C family protein-serine/threonine phosphatase [Nocardioides silvaticus]|uniref:PP2C family protein-serine/threonine phosphatase n=1 Tax=Nocardioides silvaticus TaxID=2201891 RepID=UPI0011B29959|nr:PP2C family protein-serine/threonine phosphatase [Nocardioides silvaticus]
MTRSFPGSSRASANRTTRAVALVVVIGLVLTAASSVVAHRVDRSTEERLLETQTEQAAAVLSTAIAIIQLPLTTGLQVQANAGMDGNPAVFRRTFAANISEDPLFASASLWRAEEGGEEELTRLSTVGSEPALDPDGARAEELVLRALAVTTPVVEKVEVGDRVRLVYAQADPDTGFVIKIERELPADRRSVVDDDSAFSNLDYAIYIGDQTRLDDLTTTSVELDDLPLEGSTARTTIAFGDTVLTLVTRPNRHLGSGLSKWLPLILLLSGLVLTAASALITRTLSNRGNRAEEDAATITRLYEKNNELYEEQRALFLRLQRALLPHVIPTIPELEIASSYVAGTKGIEIGGDWYSIVDVGEDHFGFVVGDVSGKGVDTVAEMARARFTLRAYLLDGKTPAEALEKCSSQFDIAVDEHIVTVIVGLGTWATGEVVVANAGHPLPLLMTEAGSDYVTMPVGPPLGVGESTYESVTVTMPPGSTLFAFTDGLVERRGEDIDVGMERLVDAVEEHRDEPLADLVTSVLAALHDKEVADDTAVLALRRSTLGAPGSAPGGSGT